MEDTKDLKQKMIRVVESLSASKGEFALFALNFRPEVSQWDIVASADWISYDALRDNIAELIKATKVEFNGQTSTLFLGFHPLITSEPFVESIRQNFSFTDAEPKEYDKIRVGNSYIEKLILFVAKPIADDKKTALQ